MIYRLQRKFIFISTVSVLSVIVLVFGTLFALNVSSMNRNLDILADTVSEGGGRFPDRFHDVPPPKGELRGEQASDFITSETPFSTRHFTVLFGKDGAVMGTNTDAIYSITEETAVEYAREAADGKAERGWRDCYRYKVFAFEGGTGVVFIDGSINRSALVQSMSIAAFVLLGCAALVLLLIALLSKRVVGPIAESYEKQKQFVTDANHELKTPLTLILANLDIAESELGKNEWLDDIRAEGNRMTELVNQLVALSRMDEDGQSLCLTELGLDDITADAVSEFAPLAESRGKALHAQIEPGLRRSGDEMLLRRLLSVLLDNAVKYCDEGGEIRLTLVKHRRIALTVENTYAAVDQLELDRLFDRFYRADKARTYTGGYGIGLSIAKAIVEKHKGSICAYKKEHRYIGFKVVL